MGGRLVWSALYWFGFGLSIDVYCSVSSCLAVILSCIIRLVSLFCLPSQCCLRRRSSLERYHLGVRDVHPNVPRPGGCCLDRHLYRLASPTGRLGIDSLPLRRSSSMSPFMPVCVWSWDLFQLKGTEATHGGRCLESSGVGSAVPGSSALGVCKGLSSSPLGGEGAWAGHKCPAAR